MVVNDYGNTGAVRPGEPEHAAQGAEASYCKKAAEASAGCPMSWRPTLRRTTPGAGQAPPTNQYDDLTKNWAADKPHCEPDEWHRVGTAEAEQRMQQLFAADVADDDPDLEGEGCDDCDSPPLEAAPALCAGKPRKKKKAKRAHNNLAGQDDDDAVLDAAMLAAQHERERLASEAAKLQQLHVKAAEVEYPSAPAFADFVCQQCDEALREIAYVFSRRRTGEQLRWCADCVRTDIEVRLRNRNEAGMKYETADDPG